MAWCGYLVGCSELGRVGVVLAFAVVVPVVVVARLGLCWMRIVLRSCGGSLGWSLTLGSGVHTMRALRGAHLVVQAS